jgi:UDP-glucose 4-epimerase
LNSQQHILVTGGAGYIGSHTVLRLLEVGYKVLVLDNLSNSSLESLKRVEAITGAKAPLVNGDVRDSELLDGLLKRNKFDAVIHFAGLKAVGESVSKPLEYYDNNVNGSQILLAALQKADVKRFVFSSSATVYGDPQSLPIVESAPTGPTNPYGRTKWLVEFILEDVAAADKDWSIGTLRYFNPVGAHKSGLIGEAPSGIPNNLLPYVSQVAVGRRDKLSVFGGDYATIDGTGVRDYIHVLDLADGHLAALKRTQTNKGLFTVNLGTGTGYSVLELVKAFEKASGKKVPYQIVDRRPGDIASCYADPKLALELLGWQATRGVDEMCADSWRWQHQNPAGYLSVEKAPAKTPA